MGRIETVASATVTIANGASLSGALQIQDGCAILGAITDSAWDTADMTFAVSLDGTNFFPLLNEAGTEVEAASVAASSAVALPDSLTKGWKYIKVRSGTSAAATNQTGATVVTLTYRTVC
jgi:hypothetical protein